MRIFHNSLSAKVTLIVSLLLIWTLSLSAQSQSDSTTWNQHDAPRLSISTPASWIRVDNSQLVDQLTTASLDANNQYTESLGYFQLNPVEIYLANPDLDATLTITSLQFDLAPSLADIATAMTEFYTSLDGIELLSADVIALSAGNAVRLHVRLMLNRLDDTQILTEQLQYIVYAPDGSGYILSANLPSDNFDNHLPTLESIINTLRFTGFQSVWFGYASENLILQAPTDWEIRPAQPEKNIQLALAHSDLNLSAIYAVTPFDVLPDINALITQMSEEYVTNGGTILTLSLVDLPIGQSIRMGGTIPQPNEAGEDVVVQQYIYVVLSESLVIATFTAEESQFEAYALTFIHMMATVQEM